MIPIKSDMYHSKGSPGSIVIFVNSDNIALSNVTLFTRSPKDLYDDAVVQAYKFNLTEEAFQLKALTNKKPCNPYKKTCRSHFYKTCTHFQYLFDKAAVQPSSLLRLMLKSRDKSGDTSLKNSNSISVKSDGDHISSSIIVGDCNSCAKLFSITIAYIYELVVNFQHKTTCCFTLSLDIPSLISVNTDSNLRILARIGFVLARIGFERFLKAGIHLLARIGYKIMNEDDMSRVLIDKPFVWPGTHLVLTMNQMLTGPGKK